jgi:pyruvate dehydrogenase E2 component (dihydrolipoamide acetyltransferase)
MEVRLPRLGEGADSGTVATIFVKEGEIVKKDQPILELESEKAVASIPAPAAGTISKIVVKEGDLIKVGQVIAVMASGGVTAAAPEPRAIDARVGDEEEAAGAIDVEPARSPATEAMPFEEPAYQAPQGVPPAASPTIRKLAREIGIDLARVRGSQRGGRIVMDDVKRYLRQLQQAGVRPAQVQAQPGVAAAPRSEPIDFSRWGKVSRKKISTLRKTISGKMVESWTTVPHITQFDNADITALLAFRKKYAAKYEKKGGHLTLTGFALKAVVEVLKHHPIFNASLDEGAGELVYKEYYHIGIAVDTEHGLIVPVIRDVNRKSLLQVSIELQELAERTRQRKVGLDEMQGGSFTISNQGGIGSGHFTPIINTPQVAILGMGRGAVTPVVRKGKVVQRTLLPLGLSYDHRVIDGADAARFMVDLVEAFENFKEADVRL